MKTSTSLLAGAIAIFAAASHSSADTLISGSAYASPVSQLPGSPTDYYLIGSSSNLTGGPVASVTPEGYNDYADNTSTILTPGGSSAASNDLYENAGTLNFLSFTLGTSSTVDYSNIDVYVLYNNSSYAFIDSSINLAQGSDAESKTMNVPFSAVAVSETTNTGGTTGDIVEFNITGAQKGETFTVAAAGNGSTLDDVGGVSFAFAASNTPEPSTLALMLAGMGLLLFVARRKVLGHRP